MAEKQKSKLPANLQEWVDARIRHRLSHAHIQMARELGFLPKSLRKIDDHRNKPWKAPLSIYIEDLYFKKFGRERPEKVLAMEELAVRAKQKKADSKLSMTTQPKQQTADPGLNADTDTDESDPAAN